MEKEQCSTCRFFKSGESESNFARCRRHPPVVFVDGDIDSTYSSCGQVWVEPDDWCGEYQAKLEGRGYKKVGE
jgi:hypothetical protein